jgi:hypothetical protein
LSRGRYQGEDNGHKEKVSEDKYCGCILYYENRRMKPVESVLRRGIWEKREWWWG